MRRLRLTKYLMVIGCLLSLSAVRGQSYNLSLGTSITQYKFINSDGVSSEFLKKGSGSHFQFGSEFRMLDTTFFATSGTTKAIYFNQRPKLAFLLSRVMYDFSVELNQLNAVGDAQNIAFNYQTNFVGASGGLGIRQPFGKGWSMSLKGRLLGQLIVQGNQQVGNVYVDLTNDSQFADIQLFGGYDIELQKRMNANLNAFISYQNMQTFHSQQANLPSLNFQNSAISFGIKISK